MIKKIKHIESQNISPKHPYIEFEGTPLWLTVKKTISNLKKNQDLKLTTCNHYVVGYICKQIAHGNLATKESINKINSKKPTKERDPN